MLCYIFHDAIVQSEIKHQTFKSRWSTKEKLKVFTEEKYGHHGYPIPTEKYHLWG